MKVQKISNKISYVRRRCQECRIAFVYVPPYIFSVKGKLIGKISFLREPMALMIQLNKTLMQ